MLLFRIAAATAPVGKSNVFPKSHSYDAVSNFFRFRFHVRERNAVSGGSGESIVYCVLLYSHCFLCHLSFISRSSKYFE